MRGREVEIDQRDIRLKVKHGRKDSVAKIKDGDLKQRRRRLT